MTAVQEEKQDKQSHTEFETGKLKNCPFCKETAAIQGHSLQSRLCEKENAFISGTTKNRPFLGPRRRCLVAQRIRWKLPFPWWQWLCCFLWCRSSIAALEKCQIGWCLEALECLLAWGPWEEDIPSNWSSAALQQSWLCLKLLSQTSPLCQVDLKFNLMVHLWYLLRLLQCARLLSQNDVPEAASSEANEQSEEV